MRVSCETKRDPVWRIRLEADDRSRPGEIVLSAKGLMQLGTLLGEATADERCRVVVLEGSGGSFCRGMDLEALIDQPATHASTGVRQFAQVLRAVRGCPKTVIALVDGVTVAGGVGLAAAADQLIATRRSSFGLPEVVLGMVPSMVLPLLYQRMAPQKARWLALLGQSVTAEEAAAAGLVDEVVDTAEDLERRLRQLARQLLRLNPRAVHRLKQLGRRVAELGCDEAIEAGAAYTGEILANADNIAHVRSFLAGEPLPWFERYRPTRTAERGEDR